MVVFIYIYIYNWLNFKYVWWLVDQVLGSLGVVYQFLEILGALSWFVYSWQSWPHKKGIKGLGEAGRGMARHGASSIFFFFLSIIFGMNNLMEQPPSLPLSPPSSLLKSINNYDDFLICQSLYLDLSNIIILWLACMRLISSP